MKYNVNIGDAWYGYTVNVSPMFVLAFNCEEGIKCLDGLFGNKASMIIESAIKYFTENKKLLSEFNRDKAEGSYIGALNFLRNIHAECLNHKRRKISITL